MIKEFVIKTANNNYGFSNDFSGFNTMSLNGMETNIEASIYHDGLDGNFKGLDVEIMKFLMSKHYKNISFEELDKAIREKYVEYFI